MPLTVLYFAVARERAGVGEERFVPPPGPLTVQGLLDFLCERHPGLTSVRAHLRVAVNGDFVALTDAVPDGAEVAIIPPVAGGAGLFRIVDRPLVLEEVIAAVLGVSRGGLVTFTGTVREETRGRRVLRLAYEAYAPMAERALARIGEEAEARWPGARLAIVHRVGTLSPGESAVVIAAAAPHRASAFEACRHAIERLKEDVPIWKKELFEDGEQWVGLGP